MAWDIHTLDAHQKYSRVLEFININFLFIFINKTQFYKIFCFPIGISGSTHSLMMHYISHNDVICFGCDL